MIAHLQHEPVSTSLGLSRWEDWVASGWPSPWTSAPPTQIHQYRARKVRSFGKGKCIGSGQDMCVMGLGVLCCRGLWALAPPALGSYPCYFSFWPGQSTEMPRGILHLHKVQGEQGPSLKGVKVTRESIILLTKLPLHASSTSRPALCKPTFSRWEEQGDG